MTASAPTLLWRDATDIVVLCLVPHAPVLDHRALEADIGRRVVREVERDAPLPVAGITHGDPRVIAPTTVALLVHASVQIGAEGPLVAFSIRPFRAASEHGAPLFGAAPRAVALGADGRPGAEFDAAIDAALKDTLPWRADEAAFRSRVIRQ